MKFHPDEVLDGHPYRRMGVFVLLSTLVITASIIGVLAIVEGLSTGFGQRIPWYLIATSLLFVTLVFVLETQTSDGRRILVITVVLSLVGLVTIVLVVEGLLFAVSAPYSVLLSELILYFFAAGLLATGLGYWLFNHWRELLVTQ